MKNKELAEELKKRFEIDQKCTDLYDPDFSLEKFEKVCLDNTLWLKNKISDYGWLSSDLVEEQGELFAWLIVQHSADLNFQKDCLRLLKSFPVAKARNGHIAYLTDRILIKETKKQLYGTQFYGNKPIPINDINNLDKRREEMSLGKFVEYYKIMTHSE